MNIRDIFITLRYKISYGSTVEWYNFWYIVLRKKRKIIPQVASIDETIRKIIADRCSVSRFGDGDGIFFRNGGVDRVLFGAQFQDNDSQSDISFGHNEFEPTSPSVAGNLLTNYAVRGNKLKVVALAGNFDLDGHRLSGLSGCRRLDFVIRRHFALRYGNGVGFFIHFGITVVTPPRQLGHTGRKGWTRL